MNEYLKNSLLILNIEQNETNTQYFSTQNVNYIQQQLILKTRQRTGYTIGKQNCSNIVQAMQYFYVNYPQYTVSKDSETNVQSLNTLVINDLLKQIIANVNQYVFYRKNIKSAFEPLEYGRSTAVKGKNTLEAGDFSI